MRIFLISPRISKQTPNEFSEIRIHVDGARQELSDVRYVEARVAAGKEHFEFLDVTVNFQERIDSLRHWYLMSYPVTAVARLDIARYICISEYEGDITFWVRSMKPRELKRYF